MPTTADAPKCFAEVGGRRILDWTVDALKEAGLSEIVFIGGYRIEAVQEAYPQFTFRHNRDWVNNNILASLFCAEDLMDEPFVCCYSDCLFTSGLVHGVIEEGSERVVSVDVGWRQRYAGRTEHPTDDAEKVMCSNGDVTRIEREIPEDQAYGEFTGVARFGIQGADDLKTAYAVAREAFSGSPFRGAALFEKAYLIHLLQQMIEEGVSFGHADTAGEYIEIDTQQDFEYARNCWTPEGIA
tara:strand:- start:515 stop:1237 length:723 start_codon:yes stop_codon:yes gene_type:complete